MLFKCFLEVVNVFIVSVFLLYFVDVFIAKCFFLSLWLLPREVQSKLLTINVDFYYSLNKFYAFSKSISFSILLNISLNYFDIYIFLSTINNKLFEFVNALILDSFLINFSLINFTIINESLLLLFGFIDDLDVFLIFFSINNFILLVSIYNYFNLVFVDAIYFKLV